MNARQRRRVKIALLRIHWRDILVVVALAAVTISALLRWPDKILADVAIPVAFLIAFIVWRER